jgi:hypothetical protein
MSEEFSYTLDQKNKVINFWNSHKGEPPSLTDIVRDFTGGGNDDPRSKEGRVVRQILADAQLKAQTKKWEKVEAIILTPEQKTFIENNSALHRPMELAKTLWPNENVVPLGRHVRAVAAYVKEIGGEIIQKGETLPEGNYEPPRTIHQIMAKVNVYLNVGLSLQTMTAYDRKCLEFTIQCLLSPRFIQEINSYATVEKRTSFESEFIRGVWGKLDLLSDEINLILNWCADIIEVTDAKKQAEKLKQILEDTSDTKVSMSLVESISVVNTHIGECLKRQERIYGLLNKSRAKRDEEKQNKHASLAALFEFFREEENRNKMLRQEEILRQARKDEVKRMESLSDTVLLSLGLSAEEI